MGKRLRMTTRERVKATKVGRQARHGVLLTLALTLLVAGFVGVGILAPRVADAWPTKYSSCTACHTTQDADAQIFTFINGTQTTSIAVSAGQTFEIDYYFTNATNAAGGYGIGHEIAVPTGWTIAAGTATYAPSGWSTAWNNAAGKGAWSGAFNTASEYASSPVGYSIDFNGTAWDTGTRNAAYDNGVGGQDLDGTAERMGADARITVPAGTPAGVYYVVIEGIGHDTVGGKAHVEQTITVTVGGGGDTTPPTVSSTNPANGATGIALNSAVTINFSENIDCTTVSTSTVTLSPAATWTRTSCSGSQAVFTPSGQANSTLYTVTVGTGVRDLAANALASAYPFSYTTVAAGNVAPATPAGLGQFKSDTTTAIAQGGTTNESTVVFKATVTDANSDPVSLDIEVVTNGNTFAGNPTCSSTAVASGSVAIATCTGLVDGIPYKWRARTDDGLLHSAWVDFGGSDPDFTVSLTNTTPGVPTSLAQYQSDGTTTLASGATAGTNIVVIGAQVDGGNADKVLLEVDTNSDGTVDCSSAYVTGPTVAKATCSGLADGSYNWQVRARDYAGATSAWAAFSGTPDFVIATGMDVGVDTTAPTDGSFSITPGDGVLRLSWTAASDGTGSGLAGSATYKVVKATGASAPADCSGTALSSGTGTAYNDTSVVNGTTYSYRVCAYDKMANVSTGATASAVPAAGPDTTPPTVVSTVPNNGATGVTPNSAITINFSENMDCTSVTTSTVTISPAVTWSRSCSANQAVFTPTGQAKTTTYTVTVGTGVLDLAGNPLAAAYPFSYTTAANATPGAPASLGQFKSDGTTAITQGGSTNESTVVIKGTVSDPDSDPVTLEVEVVTNGNSFSGTPTCVSAQVASGSVASATCSGFTDGIPYKWRARATDGTTQSAWTTYGASDPDFTVSLANTAPLTPTTLAQYQSDGTTTLASGATATTNIVVIGAQVDGGNGDPVLLEVDVNSDGTADCSSSYVTGPAPVKATCSGLADGSFNWQVRARDYAGGTSAWAAFSGTPDFVIATGLDVGVDTTAPTDGALSINPGDGVLALSWTTASDGTGSGLAVSATYKVVKASGATAPADCSGTALYSGTGSAYSDTAVTNGTTYSYRVCAYDKVGNLSAGTTASAAPSSAPVNNTIAGSANATAASATSISVTMPYSGDANATNTYTVEYKLSAAGTWTAWVTGAAHTASPYITTITGLTAGSSYDVRMTYIDADGVTGTNPVTRTAIVLPVYATTAGTATATAASASTISVSMPYTGDGNATNTYTVEYKLSAAGTWTAWTTGAAHTASPYATTITGLTPGSSYDVRMTYNDADGVTGTNPQTVSAIVLPVYATTAGTATATAASGTTISVSMPYTGDGNATNTYTVEYKLSAAGTWTAWTTGAAHTASPYTTTITGLTPGSSYDVRMTYIDSDGVTGTNPQTVSGVTLPVNGTAAGTATATAAGPTSISVSMPYTGDQNSTNTYTVEYKLSAAGTWTAWVTGAAHTASPYTTTITGLTAGSSYDVRMTYIDADGVTGTNPQTVSAIVLPNNTTTVGTATATAASESTISVSMPYSGDANSNNTYTVDFKLTSSGTWTNWVTNAAHTASPYTTTITGLTPGSSYDVRATYVDADGVTGTNPQTVSGIVMPVNATTVGTATALPAGSTSINVSMPYTNDGNASNTYTVDYKLTSSGTWTNWRTNAAHTASPYSTTITGLTTSTSYDVRVTYNDTDGVSGTNPQIITGIVTLQTWANDNLLHNSLNLGTKYGKWGTDEVGSKYGAFVCTTCHSTTTNNVKRIAGTIVAPQGSWSTSKTGTLTATFGSMTSFGRQAQLRSSSLRICEVCHSKTTVHTYKTTTSTWSHNGNTDCTDCHKHSSGFKGEGGACLSAACHGGVPGGSVYVTRNVASDFTVSSRHVFGGSVSDWECVVCHREGDESQAAGGNVSTTALHKNGSSSTTRMVKLRNVDAPTTGWDWNKNAKTNQMYTDMDTFCLNCHDTDGARNISVKTGATGIDLTSGTTATANALKPFNDALRSGGATGSFHLSGYYLTRVLDVKTQFSTSNPAHHAVLGKAYNTVNANWPSTAWVSRTLKNGTQMTTVRESAQLHCADCHTVDQNAHGASTAAMLIASTVDGTCWSCHSNNVYNFGAANETQSRFDHSTNDGQNTFTDVTTPFNSACLNCHGGDPEVDGYGGIHGLPGNDPRSGQPRYRFIGGVYMAAYPGTWTGTSGTTPTCYFQTNSKTQPFASCAQHNSNQTGRITAPNYSRGTPGQY